MLFCLMVDLSSRRIIIDCIKSIYRKVNTLFYFKKFRTGHSLFLFYIFKYQGHTEVTLLFLVNELSAPWHKWGGKLCHPSNQSLKAIRLEPPETGSHPWYGGRGCPLQMPHFVACDLFSRGSLVDL